MAQPKATRRSNACPRPSSWVGAAITGSLLLAGVQSCGPAAPSATPEHPVAEPSGTEPATAQAEVLRADVSTDGVHVRFTAPHAGFATATVRLANGKEATARVDADGNALIELALEDVFANADAPSAVVHVEGRTKEIDLSPLISAMKRNRADAWDQLAKDRDERRAQADKSVDFAGTVYRDMNTSPLVDKCSPTGAEKCFDGIDNDCDGRYDDRSCGYQTGVLQWTLTWPGTADLDLHVVGPDGVEVSAENRTNASTAMTLDRACSGRKEGSSDCAGGNVENVFIPADKPPKSGTYSAWVEVKSTNATGAPRPISCRLAGRIGGRTWYTDVKLAPVDGADYRVAFPVGADTDGDGVEDSQDACPKDRGCYTADRRYRGCPDQDHDGVADSIDACPVKAGLTSDDKKKNGCPLVFGDAWVTNLGVRITSRIEFATGKSELKPASKKTLGNVARAIKEQPKSVTKLAIDGHTDHVGDEDDNIALSHRRADAVLKELVRQGIERDKLVSRGFGELEPIADNESDEGRQKNRRVEFLILKPVPQGRPECFFQNN